MGSGPDHGGAVQQAHRLFWFPGLQIFCVCCSSFHFLKKICLSFPRDKSSATVARWVGEQSGASFYLKVHQNFFSIGPSGSGPSCWSCASLSLSDLFTSSSHCHLTIQPFIRSPFTQPSIHLTVLPIQTSVLLLRPLTHFTVQSLHTYTHTRKRVKASLEKSLARMFIMQHFQLGLD